MMLKQSSDGGHSQALQKGRDVNPLGPQFAGTFPADGDIVKDIRAYRGTANTQDQRPGRAASKEDSLALAVQTPHLTAELSNNRNAGNHQNQKPGETTIIPPRHSRISPMRREA